ncbi:hypothetical protein DB346_15865 [Verrucomicrobia bacterium LW23]|nr:hypothetical protein DB346_15865 [Verrucomicrobia bacterium LW23]
MAGVCTGAARIKPCRPSPTVGTAASTGGTGTGSTPRLVRRVTPAACLLAAAATWLTWPLVPAAHAEAQAQPPAGAEQTPATPAEKPARPALPPQPHASLAVTRADYSADGRLVLCVRIGAPTREVSLGISTDTEKAEASPFTMDGSYLEGTTSKTKIPALADLPKKPYFGPNNAVTRIPKGGWLELSVAFPALPAPAEGAPAETYSLHIPQLRQEPVVLKNLPAPPSPK